MKALVYGKGISGLSVKKLLIHNSYEVEIVDDNDNLDNVKTEIKSFDFIVKSPGINNKKPLILLAKENGIKIVDEIEVASWFNQSKLIAITGTNGKTTTVMMINDLLTKAGYKSTAAGNIGNAFSKVVLEDKNYDYIVLELSSYQLEHIERFKPFISGILNLAPDHMNRYDTICEYYKTKLNIVKNQDKSDYVIVNTDDEMICKLYREINIEAKKIYISTKCKKESNVFLSNEFLCVDNEKIINIKDMGIPGIHNVYNGMFAVSVGNILGIPKDIISEFLKNTKSIEHRLEVFLTKGNTLFVNDSKATNVSSTLVAIKSFKENIILICGGEDKNLDLEELCDEIIKNVNEVILIGETANKIEKILQEKGYGKTKIKNKKELEKAVYEISYNIDYNIKNIVLLSPAASSFDQFKNYEQRGKLFKDMVKKYCGGMDVR